VLELDDLEDRPLYVYVVSVAELVGGDYGRSALSRAKNSMWFDRGRNRRSRITIATTGACQTAANAGARSSALVSIVAGIVTAKRPSRCKIRWALSTVRPDNLIGVWRVAQDVPLGRLLTLSHLWLADMQVEDVVLGVIVGVVKAHRPDFDVHALHDSTERYRW
jgi:hypothetical protein